MTSLSRVASIRWPETGTASTIAAQVSQASLQIDTGVRVGPYLVERQLAHSRTSTIYVVREPGGSRAVLRVVASDAATRTARARMKREARALAGVDHPGVVRVLGTGEHAGMPWVATEFVRGTPLAQLVADRGAMSIDGALRHTIQAAEALFAAHNIGVVHREIDLSNLLLTPSGRIVIVGFAMASRSQSDPQASGANGFWAPEQIEHGLADERSDLWALGCVLYELVVGVPPFGRGTATSSVILRDEPVFPAHLPSTIVDIVKACTKKNSFARIAACGELLALLRDALDDPRCQPVAASVRPPANEPLSRGLSTSAMIPPPPRLPSMTIPSPPSHFSSGTTSRPPSSATRVAVPRGRIKGAAIRAGIAWFAEAYGERGLARVLELASPELRALLRPKAAVFGFIVSGWYSTRLVGELVEIIECVASPADPAAFGLSVGGATAQDNVSGVHRALFRLVSSPALLEANAQRVWRTYVDEGTLSVRLCGPGSLEARVRGWSLHHPSVCRTLREMLAGSLRAVGYGGLVLEPTQCVALGDTQCAFRGRWIV